MADHKRKELVMADPFARPWRESYRVHRSRGGAEVVSENVGTREELLTMGFLNDSSRLPTKPRGCVSTYEVDGLLGNEKISMLADGRLRVTLDGPVAARRDHGFLAFLAAALTAPG